MAKYKAYPEYKDSGVEWLGEVPKDWNILSLKSIALIVNGSTPKSGVEEYWDGDINWITPTDLSQTSDIYINDSQRKITYQGLNSCGTSLVPEDTVILSTRAPIGSLAITTIQSCTNQGCKSLVVKNKIYSLFLYYYLSMSTNPLNNLGRGSTFLELSTEDLGSFKVSIPDIGIEKIVTFLSYETAKIDNLIEKQQQLIELLKEKRQAVISHAVTKGLNPDVPMKDSGNDLLGKMPVHWKLTPMRFLSDNITVGIVVTPAKYYIDNGIRCFRSLNISENKIKDAEWVYISEASNNLLSKSKVYTDDILVVRSGQPGTAAVVDHEFDSCNCIDLIIIRSSERFNSNYICMQINSVFIKKQVGMASDGAIQQHFNVEVAKALVVVEPPKHEQSEIFKFLSEKNKYFERLIERSELQITLLRERRTALISAAVTGKIDVRDWVAPDTQEIEKTEETAA